MNEEMGIKIQVNWRENSSGFCLTYQIAWIRCERELIKEEYCPDSSCTYDEGEKYKIPQVNWRGKKVLAEDL